MRVVIVHEDGCETAGDELIVESLSRLFPAADVVPVSCRGTGGAMRSQLASRRSSRVSLGNAEFVVSTSCRAANLVQLRPGTLHVCYLAERAANADLSLLDRSSTSKPHLPLEEFPRMMAAVKLGSLAAESGDAWGRLPRKGVTHFLAGNGSIAHYLSEEIGRPVKVISPPVAIEEFRPNRQQRSDYYLMMAQAGERSTLDLAIEACRLARRRLVVLTEEPLAMAYQGRSFSHVQFLAAAGEAEVRWQINGCRAVLCPREVDFDSSVIEAQACGIPVIVSSRSGVAETVLDAEGEGQGTGLFFDAPIPESLAEAMLELERRPQKFSASLAWAHARKFSVERFEREMAWFLEAVRAASAERPLFGEVDRPAA